MTRPLAQHGHPVARGEHLGEPVGDEHHGRALRGHGARSTANSASTSPRGEDGGRLVEDQDLGPPVERLEDLDPLAHPDRQVADPGRGIDLQAVPLGELGHARRGRGAVERAGRGTGSAPITTFSATVSEGNSRKSLVHHAEPVRDGVGGRAEPQPGRRAAGRARRRGGAGRSSIDISVDLPAPFSPTTACTSPGAMARSTPSFGEDRRRTAW